MRLAVTVLGLLVAGNCHAEGILYVDPFAILGWIGLYLLGFIALPIVIYKAQVKLPWIIVLVSRSAPSACTNIC